MGYGVLTLAYLQSKHGDIGCAVWGMEMAVPLGWTKPWDFALLDELTITLMSYRMSAARRANGNRY